MSHSIQVSISRLVDEIFSKRRCKFSKITFQHLSWKFALMPIADANRAHKKYVKRPDIKAFLRRLKQAQNIVLFLFNVPVWPHNLYIFHYLCLVPSEGTLVTFPGLFKLPWGAGHPRLEGTLPTCCCLALQAKWAPRYLQTLPTGRASTV